MPRTSRAGFCLRLVPTLLSLGLLLHATDAHAATIVVNSTSDDAANTTDCTLRDAVSAAQTDAAVDGCTAGSGADTITIPAGTYTLSQGQITIASTITFAGAGVATTTIDAASASRHFELSNASANLTLRDLRLTGGLANGGYGGSINALTSSTLAANRVRFDHNVATANGGAISLDHATVTLEDCELDSNRAKDNAGSIENYFGTLTIRRCRLHDNEAGYDGSGGGGALTSAGSTGVLTMVASLLDSNHALGGNGGGLYVYSGTATITSSTFTGNTATGFGGGVGLQGAVAALRLSFVTITKNSASSAGGIGGSDASGSRVVSSIVSGNTATNASPDCNFGALSSEHHNVVGSSTGCAAFTASTDHVDVDPLLLPLADRGGVYPIHGVDAGSPARLASDCKDATDSLVAYDQRGIARNGYACTIGAYEAVASFSALVAISPATAGTCPASGSLVTSGLDVDADGVLDASEVTTSQTICDGEDGLVSLVRTSAVASGATCEAGGTLVETGLDADRSGVLDDVEVTDGETICDGASALQALVVVTPEAAGATCPNGGDKIEVGLDLDDSGILEVNEVTDTSYVCDGTRGFDSLLVQTAILVGDALCANGGIRIDSGLDDGGTSDVASDGALGSTEVDMTSSLCAGLDGSNGAAGAAGTDGVDGMDGVDGTDGVDGVDGRNASGGCSVSVGASNSSPIGLVALLAMITLIGRRSRTNR